VTHGTNIKYTGLGDNLFNTIPRGDLYVQFNVHPAENFIVNNIDLYTPVSVNCLLAITGGLARVTGLDGKEFELTVPPGTQPNTRFRIHNQGLYQMNTETRGHLYAEVLITVPQDLSEQQIEIVRNLLNP
jgi:DnaJ-class molecular chaperone